MADCITINFTEHLPQEDTLLLHYTITCSGTWDIIYNATAYRNVCDTEWTVMFPNIQHPRHSDFPITVADTPINCIFAWNYGGIRGVSAQNFDPQHSYLVQLGIFDNVCGQTGNPTTGSNTGGSSNTGSNTGGSSNTGQIPTGILSDPIRDPPFYTNTLYNLPSGLQPEDPLFGQNYGVSNTAFVNTINPFGQGINLPIGSLPFETQQTSSTTIPQGTQNEIESFPTEDFPSPTRAGQEGINDNVLGTNWETQYSSSTEKALGKVRNITDKVTPQTSFPEIDRPSTEQVGRKGQVSSNQSVGGRSNAIAKQPSLALPTNLENQAVDLGATDAANFGNIDGYLNKFDISENLLTDKSSSISLSHIDNSQLLVGSKTLLEIPFDDIFLGERVFFSSSFVVTDNLSVNAKLELWLIDSQNRTILLKETTKQVTKTDPVTLAISANTYQSPVGSNTVVVRVLDTNSNTVIGVASKKFIIRPTLVSSLSNIEVKTHSINNSITMSGVPQALIEYINITNTPYQVYQKDSKPRSFILDKITASDNGVSALAIAGPNITSTYFISLHKEFLSNAGTAAAQALNLESDSLLGYSDSRAKLDNEELLPQSHNVALPRVATERNFITLSVGPTSTEVDSNHIIELYISDSYELRKINTTVNTTRQVLDNTAPVYTHTINFDTPYVKETLAYINHGPSSGYIPENYNLTYIDTDVSGKVTITDTDANFGDYFSLVEPRYNSYNPHKGIVYTSKI